jgi:hypothetical protein
MSELGLNGRSQYKYQYPLYPSKQIFRTLGMFVQCLPTADTTEVTRSKVTSVGHAYAFGQRDPYDPTAAR